MVPDIRQGISGRTGQAHLRGMNWTLRLLPPQGVARLGNDLIMITILMLLHKPPGFGFRRMDKQAPALGASGNIDAMKNFS
jgi:hypothetical protein